MASGDPRIRINFGADDERRHAQGGDLPPVVPPADDADVDQARAVFDDVAARADAAEMPPAPAGAVELITVVGAGGLPLGRYLAVVDSAGQVLIGTPQPATSEEELLAVWHRVCEVMADAFDDDSQTYFLARRYVDQQGRPAPGPTT